MCLAVTRLRLPREKNVSILYEAQNAPGGQRPKSADHITQHDDRSVCTHLSPFALAMPTTEIMCLFACLQKNIKLQCHLNGQHRKRIANRANGLQLSEFSRHLSYITASIDNKLLQTDKWSPSRHMHSSHKNYDQIELIDEIYGINWRTLARNRRNQNWRVIDWTIFHYLLKPVAWSNGRGHFCGYYATKEKPNFFFLNSIVKAFLLRYSIWIFWNFPKVEISYINVNTCFTLFLSLSSSLVHWIMACLHYKHFVMNIYFISQWQLDDFKLLIYVGVFIYMIVQEPTNLSETGCQFATPSMIIWIYENAHM